MFKLKAISFKFRYAYIYFIFLAKTSMNFAAVVNTEKLWSLITVNGEYDNLVYYVEPQLRLIYGDNVFQQFLTNVGLGYKVDPEWQLWFGQTFSADGQDEVPGSADEYRLWQQIVWNKKLQDNLLISRTRFEERKSLFFAPWSYRLRQRLLLNTPLSNNLSLVLSDEIFYNVNKVSWIITNSLDQNRLYIGLEQRLSKNTYLGIGYMSQYLSTAITQVNNVFCINWRIDLETLKDYRNNNI